MVRPRMHGVGSVLGWVAAAGALVLLLVVAVLAWRLRERRRAARRVRLPARPKHPVVLAHGILGFDELKLPGAKAEYFRGVAERLRDSGAQVHALKVSPLASIAERAAELSRLVNSIDAKQVNIIAHSMGGLDARFAISRLGLAAKVASLTTIGTPHHGTPLADLGTKYFGDRLGLKKVLQSLGLTVQAFYDLTTEKMAQFNRDVPDAARVQYASYVSAVQDKVLGLNPMLIPIHLYLSREAGPNDGLVPLSSQRWGEVRGEIAADHWAQIGWSLRFDAPSFYARLVSELRERGL